MAQLIKLQDYVSRYAQDIYLYPSRYVRLKKKQWEGIKAKWENGPEEPIGNLSDSQQKEQSNTNILHKLKSMVRQQEPVREDAPQELEDQDDMMDDGSLDSISNLKSIEELKQRFP